MGTSGPSLFPRGSQSHDSTRVFSSVTPETAHFLSEDYELNPDSGLPEGNAPAAHSVSAAQAPGCLLCSALDLHPEPAQSPALPTLLVLSVPPQLETPPHEGKKMKVKVTQACPTVCDPMNCSPPGQNTGVASRDLSDLGIEPRSPALQVDSLASEPPRKGPKLPGPHAGQQPGLPSRLNS